MYQCISEKTSKAIKAECCQLFGNIFISLKPRNLMNFYKFVEREKEKERGGKGGRGNESGEEGREQRRSEWRRKK